jgi:hypothetical protein
LWGGKGGWGGRISSEAGPWVRREGGEGLLGGTSGWKPWMPAGLGVACAGRGSDQTARTASETDWYWD